MSIASALVIMAATLGPWLASGHGLHVEEYAPADQAAELRICTHIAFVNGKEVITDLGNDRFLYRSGTAKPWQTSPVVIDGAHSLTFVREQGLYYANDTENHRMIAFASLEDAGVAEEARELGGVALDRVHDVVHDPGSGWLYALNPNQPVVFRFKSLEGPVDVLDLSDSLAYSRALTFARGALYVAGSSQGKVAQVRDFGAGDCAVYLSWRKRREAPAGNWRETGLIPNDLEWFGGYWYVSSYFTPDPAYSAPDADANRNKLIRFRSWRDFETGNWEDLSALLPRGITPYFFTRQGGALYLAAFFHDEDGEGRVFRITQDPPPN